MERGVGPQAMSGIRRAAVIAYHSSPLTEPGSGDAGGMTIYVRKLATALASRSYSTDIFTRATNDAARVVQVAPGVRVIQIEAGPLEKLDKEEIGAYRPEFVAGVRAFALAQRVSYDLIHSHYWQSGLTALELARSWGVPLVHSHHTLGRVKNRYLPPGDAPEGPARLEGEAEIVERADVLVGSTDDELLQLACLYGAPHDRLKTLNPGVDHSAFHPNGRREERAQLGFGDESILLCVGRIQRLKGIDLAIEAVDELRSLVDRPVRLAVVGGPSGRGGERELARLRELARVKGLADSVSFFGPQPHDRLPAFYRAADALLVCSFSESFGLAALEAHACGTPVVGTPVGGLSHIVRDGGSGWLIGKRDPVEIANRLGTLLTGNGLWRSFSAEAVASAAGFSWDRTAAEFMDLYECLAREEYPELCTC
jgi:D-inositol-3-phosphate glycosyltransferase